MEYLSAKSGGEHRRVARVLHTPELPFCNDAMTMSQTDEFYANPKSSITARRFINKHELITSI